MIELHQQPRLLKKTLGEIQMIRDKKRKLLSALALSMWIGRQINDERNISDINGRDKSKRNVYEQNVSSFLKLHCDQTV